MVTIDKILRVFPRKTSYTPTDLFVYYPNGQLQSPMWSLFPKFNEIHISCSFTWDKKYCEDLAFQFRSTQDKPVMLGGPAFESEVPDFEQGLYLRPNIIFTSRGCNNNCPWCIVPKIEGKLKEIPICQGNVIQDNNFMQTSKHHKDKVFEMLKTQKKVQFKGGLESDLIDDHFVENVRGLKIDELWLACDTDGSLKNLEVAVAKLAKAGFSREKLKCYALIDGDLSKNEERLQKIWRVGAMPFAQLYRDFTETKTKYSKEIEKFARSWQRPACINMHMKNGTDFRNYGV